MALPKQNRLGSAREFGRVHRRGVRASSRYLAVRALNSGSLKNGLLKNGAFKSRSPKLRAPKLKQRAHAAASSPTAASSPATASSSAAALLTPQDRSQDRPGASSFGISISKKVSKRAVVRNRIKRQLKAIIYQKLPAIAPGWQVVIVVRPAAVECEFDDFLRELEQLFKKLNILNSK